MASIEELKNERLAKIKILEEKNINPYPASITLKGEKISTNQARDILGDVSANDVRPPEAASESDKMYMIAGRLLTVRGQGKILFVDTADEVGKLQAVLKIDVIGEEKIKLFQDIADNGDFFAFVGKLFVTTRGEKSLEVHDWQIISKALLPLPTQYFGIENEEEKMRKRYLDFALNIDKRELFYKKAKFWQTIRTFLSDRGYLEVETPTIETTTGGAEARPFKTYHNDFDMDVYMRICVGELWQKRLLAAGFEKTFEIGRAYRNEGSSPEHLQEFTNCEFYTAYMDYHDGMTLVRDMYIDIAQKVFGKTKFSIRGFDFDLADEWREIDYATEVKNRTGIDIFKADEVEMKNKLQELGVKWEGENKERLIDTLWKYCRRQIAGPAYLINHPAIVGPLAKPNQDGKTVQMFQPIIAGSEVGRGFSELNDPRVQRSNFENQQKLIDGGDEEAMMPDFEFVEMLEHGMPNAFGYGFGERLFSFLAELPIRETQLFPLVKNKIEE